jgi:hypothetical protein
VVAAKHLSVRRWPDSVLSKSQPSLLLNRHALPELQIRTRAKMGRQVTVVLYVVAMIAVIVGVDFMFFRNRFWERLILNIGIVLVFAAFYLRFLRQP